MNENGNGSDESPEEAFRRKREALSSMCGILKGIKMTLEQAREERLREKHGLPDEQESSRD